MRQVAAGAPGPQGRVREMHRLGQQMLAPGSPHPRWKAP